MVTANAMSIQMTLAGQQAETHQVTQMSCHEDVNQDQSLDSKSHHCLMCGLCMAATSVAISSFTSGFNFHPITSSKPFFLGAIFNSLQHLPAIKPPISA